jgi:hypothetical protein
MRGSPKHVNGPEHEKRPFGELLMMISGLAISLMGLIQADYGA